MRRGVTVARLHEVTSIDPWYLHEMAGLVADPEGPFRGVRTYKSVDTCAAEFAARTPYFYSGWERPGPDGTPITRGGAR